MADVDTVTKAIGLQTKSVTSVAAVSITTVYGGVEATKITMTVEGADIRYRWDGVDPTTTTGHYLGEGNQRELYGHTNLDQLRIIAVSDTATITITAEAPE